MNHRVGSTFKHKRRSNSIRFRLSLIAASIVLASSAYAQSGPINLDIPAQPLDKALNALARQSGARIIFSTDLTEKRAATAIKGKLTVKEALDQLLSGSGLAIKVMGDGGYTVVTPSDAGADGGTLPAIHVTNRAEDAWGPANRYVAKRSATGTKSDVALAEIPVSVTVVTQAQIEAQSPDSLDQAFAYSAGIIPLTGGANRRGSVQLISRGFNISGSEPLYLNGSKFPINSLSGTADLHAYERLELLKGPASILYGQAPPGGVINLVSKRPTADTLREVEVQTGSWGRKQISADFGGQFDTEGTLGYRFTALSRNSDTMIREIADDRTSFSGALVWKPSSQTTLTLLASHDDNRTTFDNGKPVDGTVLPNPNGRISRDLFVGEPGFDKFNTKGTTVGYQLEQQLNDTWKFRQNALRYDYSADTAWVARVGTTTTGAARRLVNRSATQRNDTDKGWTFDNQLHAKFVSGAVEQTVLLGIDYVSTEWARTQRLGTAAALDVYAPVYGAPVTLAANASRSGSATSQLGFYAQDHIKLNKRWVALLGGRWDKADIDGYDISTGGVRTTSKTKADAFTYRTGLMYLFDNGVSPYINYSESFQPQAGFNAARSPFKPTSGQQYEIGFKFEPKNYNASLTAAIYELTQQNALTTDPLNPGERVQSKEIQSRGFELEGRASLSNRLDLVAAYAYTDAKVTQTNEADLGRVPASVPRHATSLWAEYLFRNGVSIGAGARYVGGSYNTANTARAESYKVVDLSLRYQLQKWRFNFMVKNLFDKYYVAGCGGSCFYGDERNFQMSAKYSW